MNLGGELDKKGRRGMSIGRSSVFWLSSIVILAFLGIPVGVLVAFAATHLRSGLDFSGVGGAAWVSFAGSASALVLSLLFGVPCGYLLARRSRLNSLLTLLVRIPMGVPPMVAGVMLLLAFGPYALFGRLLGGRLVNTLLGVTAAMTFVSIPFVIEGSRSAFSQLDRYHRWNARSLGLGELAAFTLFALPSAWAGIRTALLLGWLRAMGEFGATVLVAFHPYSLPILTFVKFDGTGLSATVPVVEVTILMTVVGAILISSIRFPTSLALLMLERRVKPLPDGELIQDEGDADGVLIDVDAVNPGFSIRADLQLAGRSSILGFSGAGKSMLLAAIAGAWELIDAQGVRSVSIVSSDGSKRQLQSRDVVLVPQTSGLVSYLTVSQQLRLAALSSGGRGPDLDRLVDEFELRELMGRLPTELSGGQVQRVAVARGIMSSARLLLLDEPFSGLDLPQRRRFQHLLSKWLAESKIASLTVTHDVDEAALLGTSLAVVSGGEVVQSGSVGDVIRSPGTATVAMLVGYENILPIEVLPIQTSQLLRSTHRDGVLIAIRAVDLKVHNHNSDGPLMQFAEPTPGGGGGLVLLSGRARIERWSDLGYRTETEVSVASQSGFGDLRLLISGPWGEDAPFTVGSQVSVSVDPSRIAVLSR